MNDGQRPWQHACEPCPSSSGRPCPTRRGWSPIARARRGGWNLVELLVVLAILSVLLGAVGIVAQRTMRYGNQLADRANRQASLARLARQFRRDVHASQQVTMSSLGNAPSDVATLRCLAADGTVFDYQMRRGRMVRIERRDDRRIGHETFDVPHGSVMQLEVSGDAPRRLASLRIAWPAEPVARRGDKIQTPRDQRLVIEALIARNHRWNDRQQSEDPRTNRSPPGSAKE
ncbi:MAG: Tfp pilus assembly protein FimT/FimU [Pirellulales bacterium]